MGWAFPKRYFTCALIVISLLSAVSCKKESTSANSSDTPSEQMGTSAGVSQKALLSIITTATDGKPDEAEAQLQKIVDSKGSLNNVDHATVLQRIAEGYNAQDKYGDAIRVLRNATTIMPQSAELWTDLGINHRLEGEMEEAEKCYIKALEIDPKYAQAHSSIGVIYLFSDRTAEAITAMEKAIQLDKTIPTVHANLSVAYATAGRFDEADASLKKAIVLGYANGPAVQQRINDLKLLEKPADTAEPLSPPP